MCPPHAPRCSIAAMGCWPVASASVRLARRLLLSCNLLLVRSQSPTQLRLHGAIIVDQNGACRLQRPSGTQGTQHSALEAAGVDTGTSRRRGANGGPTTTTSTSVGIAKHGTERDGRPPHGRQARSRRRPTQATTDVPGVDGTRDRASAMARTCSGCRRLASAKWPVSGTEPTGVACTAACAQPTGLSSSTGPAQTTRGNAAAARRRPAPRSPPLPVHAAVTPETGRCDPLFLATR